MRAGIILLLSAEFLAAQSPTGLPGTGGGGGGTGVANTPVACAENPYTTTGSKTCTHSLNIASPFHGRELLCRDNGGANPIEPIVWNPGTNADTFSIGATPTGTGWICDALTGGIGKTGPTGATGPAGSGNNAYCADATGSATTYTCPTPSPTVTTLTGLLVTFVPQTTNGATPTLNVATLGAKNLLQSDCSTAIASSALTGGSAYLFSYNGTAFCQSAGAGGAAIKAVSAGEGVTGAPTSASTCFGAISFDGTQAGGGEINFDDFAGSVHSTSTNPDRWNLTAGTWEAKLFIGCGTCNVFTNVASGFTYDGSLLSGSHAYGEQNGSGQTNSPRETTTSTIIRVASGTHILRGVGCFPGGGTTDYTAVMSVTQLK